MERGNPPLNLPSPDPSVLTTQQLHAAIDNLRALLTADIRSVETRLDAIDKATEIFSDNLTRVPTDTDRQIQHLKELHETRFKAVEMQFAERGQRTIEAITNARTALESALSFSKDAADAREIANATAISKSEHAFTKQIDAITGLRVADMHAMDGKIEDLKSRLDRTEGRFMGGQETKTERRLDTGSIVGIISAGVAVGMAIVTLFGGFAAHTPAPSIAVAPAPYVLQAPPAAPTR
jgi:hypothetical protein